MFERMTSLWRLLRGNRLRYGAAIAATVIATLFMFILPRIFQGAIDFAIDGKELDSPSFVRDLVARMGPQDYWGRNLWIPAISILALTCLSGLFTYIHGWLAASASESAAKSLRERLYDHLHHLPCRYYDHTPTGDLVQRCSSDVEIVRMFLAVQVSDIGRSGILLGVGLMFMLPISPIMTLMSTVFLPVIAMFSVMFFLRVKKTFKKMDEAEGKMTAMLQENLTCIRVVRAFARQDFETHRFAEKNTTYRQRWFSLIKLLAIFWPVSTLLCISQIALVLTFGSYMVMRGDLTVGMLFAFLAYVNLFLWPIRRIGRVLSETGKAIVSLGRIEEILDQPREDDPAPTPAEQTEPVVAPARSEGRIEFRGLTFGHVKDTNVLCDVSFLIEPGRTLAIMGPSGSGKSTIVNLLLRLYDYDQGEILLDGVELHRLDRKYIRSQIGSVLQEPFLYSRTLRDNIKIGHSSAGDEQLQHAVDTACLQESISRFEDGYETLVGERGVTLSGGQRQRVALARAILRDPPILVLDDALSSVDTRTERMIIDAIRSRSGRCTTLVIAHRISTLMHADRILVLEDGQINQSGSHRELVARDGLYRRLWRIQFFLEEDLKKEITAGEDSSRRTNTE